MEDMQWKDPSRGLHIGIYGWRKRCLYLVMVLLLIVVALNVTLVFWIMKVLQCNTNGMSYMQMVGNSIQFTRKTYIEDILVASGLSTKPGETISLQSADSLTFRTTDHDGYLASNIHLGNGKLEINTPSFKVTNFRGKTLFFVDKDTASLTAQSLSISGEGGAVFKGSLQTPIVSADISSDLRLESAMKGVQVVTPAAISIESRAGDILAAGHQDIDLITIDGRITMDSRVLMPSLRHPHHHLRKHHHHLERIYQLCVCSSGDLYLGESESPCNSGLNGEICPS